MDATYYNGDVDTREFTDPDSPDRHEPEYECGCCCPKCHRRLERDPVMGTHRAPCESCRGGEE